MLFIGIDEAGYGPLLGPLVVAGTAFRTDGEAGPTEFAARLASLLARSGVAVGDSKRLFGQTRDLATLERPLLAFLASCGAPPASLDDLLRAVGVDPAVRRDHPWYAGEPGSFPLKAPRDEVDGAARALAGVLGGAGVELAGLAAEVLPERRYNAALAAGNKADALFGVSSSVFDRLLAHRRAGERVVAVFDRHGGRAHYAVLLQRRWPEALAWTLAESPTRSDYRVEFQAGAAFVRFEVEADGRSPCVGLASMLAKYLREAFMERFNDYFGRVAPGVAPTAGYTEDGRRWLDASRAAREAAGVPDRELVRLR